MNVWGVAGVIVSILTLAGAIILHLVKTTWWMATLSANLESLKSAVKSIETVINKHELTYCTKDEATREFAHRDHRISDVEKKLENIQDHITNCNKR